MNNLNKMLIIILEFETTLKISKCRCVTILTQHGLLHINKMGKSIKKDATKEVMSIDHRHERM